MSILRLRSLFRCTFLVILTLVWVLGCTQDSAMTETILEGSGDFTFRNGDITLAGKIGLPPSPGPHPAILIIQGSGKDFTIKVFPFGNHELQDTRTGAFIDSVFVAIDAWLLPRLDLRY